MERVFADMSSKYYELPPLPYSYEALEPFISREQLRIHYEIHHRGYINGANSILKALDEARREGRSVDIKSALKALSFNIGGTYFTHSTGTIWRPPGRAEEHLVEGSAIR